MSPLRISTVADAAAEGYWFDVECKPCKRSLRVYPKDLVAAGYGDKPYNADFECSRCGKTAVVRLHAPAPQRG
jgi:hypothetical protein